MRTARRNPIPRLALRQRNRIALDVDRGHAGFGAQTDVRGTSVENERLAFPLRDGVPMMLEEDARQLASDDPLLER